MQGRESLLEIEKPAGRLANNLNIRFSRLRKAATGRY
jgi:hypothetical protein